MNRNTRAMAVVLMSLAFGIRAGCAYPGLIDEQPKILQPLGGKPFETKAGGVYIPSTPDTVQWGFLPNRDTEPLLTVASGSVVTFDSVSHEGILEDQGRDPVRYFATHGVEPDHVLDDAKTIAASSLVHDFKNDGPHVVTGPVAVEGAKPGDVLKIEVLDLVPRVPYGFISNRHGKGALPGEFPENDGPAPGADARHPDLYNNVSVFTRLKEIDGTQYAMLHNPAGEEFRFPIRPFMGIMGVAPDTADRVHSVPPAAYGGNLDINMLGAGSTLYLPVLVPGANFYTGDPHFAQGNGEVALTALEAPLRATFRLTVLAAGSPEIPGGSPFAHPFGETADYWIPVGLNPDLDEAMRQAVRQAIRFLSVSLEIDRAIAYAYLSAATDFEVSQVVDRTKGVHALIRKEDFAKMRFLDTTEGKPEVPVTGLDKLLACAGGWRGSNRLQNPKTNAPEDSPATASVNVILAGRFVRIDYTWGYEGRPQEGSLLIGHEPETDVVTTQWIDTWHMGHKVMESKGTINSDGEISVRGSYAAPPGPDWGWRTVIIPGEQQLRIIMYNISPDGREELAVEASYSRE